ncbi:MAG: Polymorphic rane protein [Phycisphaerales bacterium]|nr:Polymorphic rane protein [Phycisphaerales bacterium]
MSERAKSRRPAPAPVCRVREAAAAARPACVVEPMEGRTLFTAFIVTSVADYDPDPSKLTLRRAFEMADLNNQADTITFDEAVFNVPQTINLAAGQLNRDTDPAPMTITGPGAKLLTISGSGSNQRLFGVYGARSLDLSRMTITGGNGDVGGALRNSGGTLNVTDAVIANNVAKKEGGGVYNEKGGTTTLTRTTVSGNTAPEFGGGVVNRGGQVTLVNCTVSGNSVTNAGLNGGGVGSSPYGTGATAALTLTNTTVSGNSATGGGGGVSARNTSLTMNNTIVAGNSAPTLTDLRRVDGTFTESNNFVGGDPQLGPLQDNGGPTPTRAPLPGSPVVNAGNNAAAAGLETDQRGFARVAEGTADIGAVEVQDSGPPTVTINQAAGQADPTAASPVVFTVVFSEPVTDFDDAADVVLSGTAGGTLAATITPVSSTQYTVSVSGMTTSGTVVATVPAAAAVDATTNPNAASTSTDNTVRYALNASLVVTTTADENDGTSDPAFGAGTSLREAIAYANAKAGDDTVTFDPAAFPAASLTTITLGGTELVLNSGSATTAVQGLGAGRVAVDADGLSRVFNVTGGTAAISGLTITGGVAESGGGFSVSSAAALALTDAVVADNRATVGGGGLGGGGGGNADGRLTVVRTRFVGNAAERFGGGLRTGGNLTVTDSTFDGNTARDEAGGLNVAYGTAVVTGSTFSGNATLAANNAGGGGISVFDPVAASFVNTTVANNTSAGRGGGVLVFGRGPVRFTNVTLTGNRADSTGVMASPAGGGLAADSQSDVPELVNTIVAGNVDGPAAAAAANDLQGPVRTLGNNLFGTTADATLSGPGSNDVVAADPMLGPLADNGGPTRTVALLPGSPAVNGGDTASAAGPGPDRVAGGGDDVPLATDQRGPGFPRVNGPAVDIGAFEAVPPLPAVSVGDVSMAEGDAGFTAFTFTVTRTEDNGLAAVDWSTADGSGPAAAVAQAGLDYVAASGTVVFPAGVLSRTLTVSVVGDPNIEADQAFVVNLSNPQNATVADGQGVGTILNDDQPPPYLSVGDAAVTEGGAGTTKSVLFTVTLDRRVNQPVTFKYATAGSTATSGTDFVATSGTATIPAFGTTAKVYVTVKGDAAVENDETYRLVLSSPTNAAFARATAVGTILNDDKAPPTISIFDAPSVVEGNSGTRQLVYTVRLSGPSASAVTVKYATADGTAMLSRNDYKAKSGTLTFAAGQTVMTIVVTTVGDTRKGPNETVFVNLSAPVGATILDGKGVGTILNDD